MLEGREFTIFTDHNPLAHVLFRVSPSWSARQLCHLSYLAEFNSSIVHVPGLENVVANTLSQPSSVLVLSASVLVSPPRFDMVQVPGLTPFGKSLSRSAPFLLSPTPSFWILYLSPLQLTGLFVAKMCSSPTLSVVFFPSEPGHCFVTLLQVIYAL